MKDFKKFNDLVFNITKQVYKRHKNNYLLIMENWQQIVGEKLNKKSFPKNINKNNVLIVSVEFEYLLDFQYNTEVFKKKINSLLDNNTICKIKVIRKN